MYRHRRARSYQFACPLYAPTPFARPERSHQHLVLPVFSGAHSSKAPGRGSNTGSAADAVTE